MEPCLIPYTAVPMIEAQRVIVLAPHPDDEVFGCGGAIAAHVGQGAGVKVVVLTGGDLHGSAMTRAEESRAAAKVLGYGEPEFWQERDRELVCSEALVQRLSETMRSFKADLVYAPSPWEVHPDHRQCAWLALQAIEAGDSSCRLAFYEVGAPLRPNVLVDITPHVQTKALAMRCFVSQMEIQDYGLKVTALNRYRTYTLPPSVKAAEAFLLLQAKELPGLMPHLEMPSWGGWPSAWRAPASPAEVSVVVRSTGGTALYRALDSIALQTWPRMEVLVVSTAAPHFALAERCGRHGLRLIEGSHELSRAEAGNRALLAARGQYLLFMDDSDWLMPGHVTRLVSALQAQPQARAAGAEMAWVDFGGNPVMPLPGMEAAQADRMDPPRAYLCTTLLSADLPRQGLRFDEALGDDCDAAFLDQVARLTVILRVSDAGVARPAAEHMLLPANELAEQVQHLSQQLAQATQRVQAMLNSRSWKITRPLRALGRWWGRWWR